MQPILLSNGFHLSPPTENDVPELITRLNDPYIYARTLMLPANYSEKDAGFFLALCQSHLQAFGHPLHFSIRNPEGTAIGGCGFHGKNTVPGLAHKDEIGYWLATEYRGKGIMTEAVKKIVEYGFTTRNLLRIEAPVYSFNVESEAVLVKCGFTKEGYMPKAYFRNNEYHDAKFYAIVK
ncbi:MAG TPA: GNAT family protein [Bacteroidia bacterium]|nr:GNAT family protein [Bacteroidia bacterium]